MNKLLKNIAITTILIIVGLGNYSLAAISKVKVDFNQNLLFIYGEDLTQTITDSLTITLGNTNLTVCPGCYSTTEITADLPTGLIDGDYMLKVASYGRESVNAGSGWLHNEYNLTVGSVGPQGLPGADGSQGIQGIQGEKGDPGIQGIQGIQGVKGDKGDKGDQGDQGIQGLRGLPGADGVDGEAGNLALAGQECSGSTVPKGFDQSGNIICGKISTTGENNSSGKAFMSFWRVYNNTVYRHYSVMYITNISDYSVNVVIKIYDKDANLIKGISPKILSGVSSLDTNPQDSSMTFNLASKKQTQITFIYPEISYATIGYATIEWSIDSSQNASVTEALMAHGFYNYDYSNQQRSMFSIPINNGQPF